MLLRGSCSSCTVISLATSFSSSSLVVISTDWLSGPCSACESISAATNTGFAIESATIATSEGPAGISIDTSFNETNCFAAVTY